MKIVFTSDYLQSIKIKEEKKQYYDDRNLVVGDLIFFKPYYCYFKLNLTNFLVEKTISV